MDNLYGINFINMIKSSIQNARDVAGQTEILTRCPFCGDSKKSAIKKRGWLYEDMSFYCFNCGTGMSGIKFLEAISGANYEDLKKEFLKLFARSHKDMSLSAHYEIPSEEPSLF